MDVPLKIATMMSGAEEAKQAGSAMEQLAMQKARDRIKVEKWNRDVTVFAFAILIIVIILLYNEVKTEIVAAAAFFGLLGVWLIGWLQGRQSYQQVYKEELSKLEQDAKEDVNEMMKQTSEGDALEEKIRMAMRDMWR